MQENWKTPFQTVNQSLGEAVKKAREAAEMNQSELAAALGHSLGKTVTPTTITRLEKGTRPTPLHEVYALADVLGVPATSLMPAERRLGELVAPFKFERKMMQNRVNLLQADLSQASKRLWDTYQVESAAKYVEQALQGEEVKVEALQESIELLFNVLRERSRDPLKLLPAPLGLPSSIGESVEAWMNRLQGQAEYHEKNVDWEKVMPEAAAMFAKLAVEYLVSAYGDSDAPET